MILRSNVHLILGCAVLFGGGLGSCGAFAAEDPSGVWATEKHESQIRISHCGTGELCGTILWMKDPNDDKGNPKLDRENQDEAKRKRTILGLQLISMKPDDEHWSGTVYNPLNGKTYSATLRMLSHNEVELKGCVAYILCGSNTWVREDPKVAIVSSPAHGLATATKVGTPRPAPASGAIVKPVE